MINIRKLLGGYFSLKGYIEDQSLIDNEIRQGVSFKGTNAVILIFAIFVASLGLNTNSTAVIIGAMLISPLMGPIIGMGLSIGIQDFELLRRSLRNLAMAATISVATSCVFFLISPVGEGHSELLARTSPTIYDVLIALFGGGAGIVGMSARSKGNVIPGVAIATALMPPLCTVGYGLATWQMQYFFGALYLFLINTIFIGLATFVGVKLMHFEAIPSDNPARTKRVRHVVYAVAVLTLLPSIYLTYNMLRDNHLSLSAERFVSTEMNFPGTQVMSQRIQHVDGRNVLEVTLLGRVLPADSLQMALAPRMARYGLKNVGLNIIQGGVSSITATPSAGVSEVYHAAQTAIMAREATIDSLRTVLSGIARRDTLGAAMAPELKVVFPQVQEIAISRNVFCNVNTGSLDTTDVALIHYATPINGADAERLQRYLEARLGTRRVELVAVRAQP